MDVRSLRASLARAKAKLDAICDINEDDWDDCQAAIWVTEIIAGGKTINELVAMGMVTQEAYEESFCKD
jgi:hypothetical protein